MPRYFDQPLSGWGNYRPALSRSYRPERISELRDAIVAATDVDTVIARGLGRGYGDCAVNGPAGDDVAKPGGVVLQERMDCLVSFDAGAGTIEAEGGVSLAALVELLVPRGFFLPVTPGTKFVTLGGAIAADVHGKNHPADGTIANFVDHLHLMTAAGDVVRCSADENADVFHATLGGMGLTGVVLSAKLRLLPITSAYMATESRKVANLDAMLDRFESAEARTAKYSVAWVDCLATGDSLGRGVVIEANHLAAADLPAHLRGGDPLKPRRRRGRGVPFFLPGFVLRPLTVRAFNALHFARQKEGSAVVGLDQYFYPLDAVRKWNRIYGRRGFVQYQALVPPAAARAGLRELLETVAGSGQAAFLGVLKRHGKQGPGLLSFPTDGFSLALDLPNAGETTVALTRQLDAVALRHGGRLYLAKDATTTPETFAAMYPRLDEFRQVKAKIDPGNRFVSAQSRRLRIGR